MEPLHLPAKSVGLFLCPRGLVRLVLAAPVHRNVIAEEPPSQK